MSTKNVEIILQGEPFEILLQVQLSVLANLAEKWQVNLARAVDQVGNYIHIVVMFFNGTYFTPAESLKNKKYSD